MPQSWGGGSGDGGGGSGGGGSGGGDGTPARDLQLGRLHLLHGSGIGGTELKNELLKERPKNKQAEDCTASIWEYEDDFQIQRSPNRWSSVFWKVGLISGTVFVILGLTVLAVGFLVPPKIEAFGEADFMVVDTHAVKYNGALDTCKLAGAVLFCIGGTSMAGCLLMSVFAKSYSKEEKFLQQKFKERIADIKAHTQPITKAPGPGDTKIPVTLSRVQNVQPLSAT